MYRDNYHRLKCGRFKGVTISEIPADYLRWLLTLPDLKGWLRGVVEESINRREREQQQRQDEAIEEHVKCQLRQVVLQWFRTLAFKYHHDRGHDQNIMRALNDAHEQLKQAIEIE